MDILYKTGKSKRLLYSIGGHRKKFCKRITNTMNMFSGGLSSAWWAEGNAKTELYKLLTMRATGLQNNGRESTIVKKAGGCNYCN